MFDNDDNDGVYARNADKTLDEMPSEDREVIEHALNSPVHQALEARINKSFEDIVDTLQLALAAHEAHEHTVVPSFLMQHVVFAAASAVFGMVEKDSRGELAPILKDLIDQSHMRLNEYEQTTKVRKDAEAEYGQSGTA